MISLKHKSLALLLLVLLSNIIAVSARAVVPRFTGNSTSYHYERLVARKNPPYPSKSDCDNAIVAGQPPKDKALFYTGFGRSNDVPQDYADSHSLAHVNQDGIWNPSDFTTRQYDGTKAQRRQFQLDFSTTYAEKTTGIAYLYLSYKNKPRADSVFYKYEFAAMKASGNVDKIIWLDADNAPSDPTSITTTWWVIGDADPSTDDYAATSSGASCGLTNYWDAYHCPLDDGVDYLYGQGEGQWCAAPHSCTMPSCSYGTGIQLCNDNDVDYCTTFEELGLEAYELQEECDPNSEYGSDVDCSTTTTNAMQQFFADGHNILITGGFDC